MNKANLWKIGEIMRKEDEFDPIADLFFEDVNEKKKIGNSSIRSKSSFTMKHRLKSPMDFMTPYERAKYRKAGKIVESNLFDEILNRELFNALDPEEQKKRLQYWREHFSTEEIKKKMGISANTYYKHIERLELPPQRRGGSRERKPRTAKTTAAHPVPEAAQASMIAAPAPVSGFDIGFNGIYKADEIRKMLSKLDLILDGEESEFKIVLHITEQK
jgi:transposase